MGTMVGTGAASIDQVIVDYPIGQEFTVDEIDTAIRRLNLLNRGDKERHLHELLVRDFLRRGSRPRSWVRIR